MSASRRYLKQIRRRRLQLSAAMARQKTAAARRQAYADRGQSAEIQGGEE